MIGRALNHLKDIVKKEAFHWGNNVATDYHGVAASDMGWQWASFIDPIISKHPINMEKTMDFACGFGRNARRLKESGAKNIILVDVNQENIDYCNKNVVKGGGYETYLNNGIDLDGVTDRSVTFLYSFDAMVHFDLEIIISYMPEFYRVLASGGHALIHHSNYTGSPGQLFQQNPQWRNFMSAEIFHHLAVKCGFEILEQNIHDWGGSKDIDCITLMKKP